MNWKIRFENKPSPLPAIFPQEQNGDVRPLDPLGPAVQIEGYSAQCPEIMYLKKCTAFSERNK